MPLTNPNKVVTEERLNEYHKMILPYLGGNSMVACGGGYAPIGTVISYMGTRAPSDFLICDGTVYNISDYTELADFFELQFGSSNFFGGDGNTTFAVPDLRGEFLRGTGTNSHANQGSGANVGVHQDGTEHINFRVEDNGDNIYSSWNTSREFVNNTDSAYGGNGTIRPMSRGAGVEINDKLYFTSRPTNTSVLYCIKAKSQGNGYSLDEQIVGTWIDGKPIYQKTIDFGAIPNNTTKSIAHGINNFKRVIHISTTWIQSETYSGSLETMGNDSNNGVDLYVDATNLSVTTATNIYQRSAYITLQYIKATD